MAASDFYPPSAHTVVPPVGRRVERRAGSPRPISSVEIGREKDACRVSAGPLPRQPFSHVYKSSVLDEGTDAAAAVDRKREREIIGQRILDVIYNLC